MTSTHDLPTVAGWWQGRDLDWREQLGHLADPEAARAERERDKSDIWDSFRAAGVAQGDPPPPGDVASFADAACQHVGRSACELVMLPVEDALALVEQPNLPGTLHEHPNWQRRLPADAADLLTGARIHARLALLDRARTE